VRCGVGRRHMRRRGRCDAVSGGATCAGVAQAWGRCDAVSHAQGWAVRCGVGRRHMRRRGRCDAVSGGDVLCVCARGGRVALTHWEPTWNPLGTHWEPTGNPLGTHWEPTGEGPPSLTLLACRDFDREPWETGPVLALCAALCFAVPGAGWACPRIPHTHSATCAVLCVPVWARGKGKGGRCRVRTCAWGCACMCTRADETGERRYT